VEQKGEKIVIGPPERKRFLRETAYTRAECACLKAENDEEAEGRIHQRIWNQGVFLEWR